jgi:hypothetical protein
VKVGTIAVLIVVVSLSAGARDSSKNKYTLAVEIMATQAAAANANGREAEAHCKDSSSSVDCTAREQDISSDSSYSLSTAKASDGNIYTLKCSHALSIGHRALWVARSDGPGDHPPVLACNVPPGTYKARWNKEKLAVLLDFGDKPKEMSFDVVGSQRMTTKEIDDCKACSLAKEH